MNVQVIFFGAVDGTCSATLRAQAFRTPFFAPLTRLLSRRGLKTAHCAVFLTSRSSPVLSCKKNNLHNECTSYFFWCGRPQVKGNQALAFELPERSGHEHQQSGNAASFLAENEKKTIAISSFLLVRSMGLEPIRSPIRPSNVRVCLFRHDRKQDVI